MDRETKVQRDTSNHKISKKNEGFQDKIRGIYELTIIWSALHIFETNHYEIRMLMTHQADSTKQLRKRSSEIYR